MSLISIFIIITKTNVNKFNFISINEKHENISRFVIFKLEKRNFLNILYLISKISLSKMRFAR